MKTEKLVDASLNLALNGVKVSDQKTADRIKCPVGEIVAWAAAHPRVEL